MKRDPEGDKFKAYEKACELTLEPRLPVIIRLDGNSFSKLTNTHFEKPYDDLFERAMEETATEVLKYCSGACFAYVQSDEISVLLRNDQREETTPFLANRSQKLASLLAARASVTFNQAVASKNLPTPAIFDCRVFTVPKEETNNAFAWRQKDCYRNCIGSTLYHTKRKESGRKTAHKFAHDKGVQEQLQALIEMGITEEVLGDHRLYGRVIERQSYEVKKADLLEPEVFEKLLKAGKIQSLDEVATRSKWVVLEDTPRFTRDPSYVDNHMRNT